MNVDEIDLEAIGRAEKLSHARGLRDRLAAAVTEAVSGFDVDDAELATWIDEVCCRSPGWYPSYRLLELHSGMAPLVDLFVEACKRVEKLEHAEYRRLRDGRDRFAPPPPVCACA